MNYKPGDAIRHKPTGETWSVAAPSPDGKEIVCSGWPESIAPITDCEMVRSCTHDEAVAEAESVVRSCHRELRGSWARHWLEQNDPEGSK